MKRMLFGLLFCLLSVSLWCSNVWAEEIVTGTTLSAEAQERLKQHFRPEVLFEDEAHPPAPDYSSPEAWVALPTKHDDADLAPPNTKYPEAQKDAQADVFFIYPTGYTKKNSWNAPIDDPDAVAAASEVMKYFTSSFNAAARIYAPFYRQATLYSLLDNETTSGIQAIELAYADVERAFEYYIKYFNAGRPFILASHSQGSCHGLRLLQQKIIGAQLQKQLVAAYLIGMSVPLEIPGIAPARSAADTSGVVNWNSYIQGADPRIFTEDMATWIEGKYRKIKGRPLLQVNPLSWELKGGRIGAEQNPGSLIPHLQANGQFPPLVTEATGADASGPVLIIDTIPGFPLEGPFMPVLNDYYGDFHKYDYLLFYESIRKNALDRVEAFMKNAHPLLE